MRTHTPRNESPRPPHPRIEDNSEPPTDEAFRDLTLLASRICSAPIAVVSLLDQGRHRFPALLGLEASEMPAVAALASQTILQSEPLVLTDVLEDERFRFPPVADSGICSYAGVRMTRPDGTPVGTISVMDRVPGRVDSDQLAALAALGRHAESQLERRIDLENLARIMGEREEVELQLREANQFNVEIISGAGEGIVVYDRSFRYLVWNRFMEELTGVAAERVLGFEALELFPHLREQGVHLLLERALKGELVDSPDVTYRVPQTGKSGWVSGTYGPHRDSKGEIVGVIGIVRDVTERKRTEGALQAAEAKFRSLVEQSLVGIYVIQGGRYQYVNPKLAEILGYSPKELLALDSVLAVVSLEDRPLVEDNIRRRIDGEVSELQYAFRAVRRDGERIELEVHGVGTLYQGEPAVIGTILDITDRRRAEAQIVYHAYHDVLTDLPNRSLFMERLRLHLIQAKRQKRPLSLMYLDLDRFKIVNDTWGHETGDSFLKAVANRLRGIVREADTVARVGGDQFVVLVPDVSRTEDLTVIAQKLMTSVAQPFPVDGRNLHVTTSIGISTFPADGDGAETLLRNADTAVHRAKERGRNSFQLCTPELTFRAIERLSLQTGLRLAIEGNDLVLHYQPVVSIATGRIVGLEALVRWQHAEKGLIMPGTFISVAEETGLILPLGEWVLRTALRQLKLWHESGLPELRIAVNVSARQFREDSLVAVVERSLAEAGVQPQYLEVEITESIAMESAELVVANLQALRSMKVGISIDDFGTGYSSLTYLKSYPISCLKIDRSFVTDLATNSADAGIVRAVVEMAHGMKLNVIAEGVETQDQFAYLRRYGCDQMQGYWFSRPLPPSGVDTLLADELRLWSPTTSG